MDERRRKELSMTVREVYKKLSEVRAARVSAELLLDRLRALDSLKTSIKSILPTKDKVQTSGGGSRLENIIVEIDAKEELLQRHVHAYWKAEEEAKTLISLVENDMARAILSKRFLDGKKWEIIAMETGYTMEWTQRLKKRGVREIARKTGGPQ